MGKTSYNKTRREFEVTECLYVYAFIWVVNGIKVTLLTKMKYVRLVDVIESFALIFVRDIMN